MSEVGLVIVRSSSGLRVWNPVMSLILITVTLILTLLTHGGDMSDSIDKYIGNTMLNPMPKTAEITHNEWLLGKVPDSDLDTSYEQINVTFPY